MFIILPNSFLYDVAMPPEFDNQIQDREQAKPFALNTANATL
ncbi:hypothetical protein PROSTU_03495 [Providencia stuartii ATCC 25827]|uniref:Uncharacterized protein n=1 Tax=Providencia stuartii ATCC 25827 TaxID=471874 RepID=A0AA86YXC3_PROST|nr:hypothetical protein PROSTU_03495 [Providencia stuartii ATCC 25827]